MRYDLKKPCLNCPFGRTDTRIVFRGRDRASEIAETAYRHGFPCHLSAELHEYDNGENSGFVPGENTQHCAGALAMFGQEAHGEPWPGIDNDEDELERIVARLEPIFPQVFTEEEFIEANRDPRFDRRERTA